MPLVFNSAFHDERFSMVRTIKSQWKVANPTDVIPADMRYSGLIGTWPLPILRAITYLARRMPGEEGRDRFVNFLNTGYLIRTTGADESATAEPQLQSSDLEFVRDSIGLEPAAVKVEEEAASVQNDVTHPKERPERILPEDEDEPETLKLKLDLWIQYYWNVTDIKALVPRNMRQLDKFGKPTNRALHSSSDQKDLLKVLYQLARITKGRKDAAWAQIEEAWKARGGKAFAESDVKVALDHFRDLREEEEDDDSVTNSRKQLPIAPSNPDGTTGEEGQDGAMNTQRGNQHRDGRQRKRRRRESRATEPDTHDSADHQTLLSDVDVAEAGLSMARSRRSSVMVRRDNDRTSIATRDTTVDEAATSLQGARGASTLPLKRKRRYSLDGDQTDVDEKDGKTGDDGKDERAEQEHDEPEPEEAQDPSDDWAVLFETEDAPQDGEREDQTRG
ncbi:hypothetical protein J4E83_010433 [Alternaria metachromatica]|uniref:uncharacterized protein n=1 Tax=Alternaria metachromatica TaxID=283354 RepID=UPI0020C53953|nr:uncharacterized protein J4E83_010433 [Alternaria metachromatica]KAI4605770.1 hypothetical protein J4E83_010433 [Alternaria metachromatica]